MPMRPIALLVPLVAFARPPKHPKKVEVTNLPAVQAVTGTVEVINLPEVQDVYVVNPPDPAPAIQDVFVTNPSTGGGNCEGRFQLMGFTTETYTGNMGGHLEVTLKCQLEFPGSRMCTSEEYANSATALSGESGFAWIKPSLVHLDPGSSTNFQAVDQASTIQDSPTRFSCNGWRTLTSTPNPVGLVVEVANGKFSRQSCTSELKLTCCGPSP